jgi:ubiquinone/menaquinone biosynthesis C-methylase UbiE
VPTPAEPDRLADVYEAYRDDPRRQRAWAADNPGNQAIRREVATRLRDIASRQLAAAGPLLDAGCGTGYWLQWLTDQGVSPGRIVGIDLLEERVAAAQRRAPAAEVRQADVQSLPFPDGRFDLVLLLTVLSSQPSLDAMRQTLREGRRVLAPGGLLVVWDVRWSVPGRPTRAVPARLLRACLGDEMNVRSMTLLPPLARRLGRTTGWAYPGLARIPLLRTHNLAWVLGRPEPRQPAASAE